ncbi:MAG: glycosyltransferase [Myxococcales bacterium]|nr:glycosyltransferase [Myxococcales bacterium]
MADAFDLASMPPVRVLHLVPRARPGSISTLMSGAFRVLEGGPVRSSIASLRGFKGGVEKEFEAHGVKTHALAEGFPTAWRQARALTRIVRDEGIQILHLQRMRLLPLALGVRRRVPGLKLILHLYVRVRVPDGHERHSAYAKRARVLARHQADVAEILCVSEAVRRDVQVMANLGAERGRVVYNGFDVEAFRVDRGGLDKAALRERLGMPRDARVVLATGRLVKEKDLPTLLRAAERVREKDSGVYFAIVGDGRLREFLEETVRARGLGESVRLFGYRDDLLDFLRVADVFCVTSEREGQPIALLEAQVAGLPAVVTDCGGTSEVVRDRENGRIVPVGDDAAVAAAILEVLGDDALRTRMAEAAVRVGEAFTIERMALGWAEVYRDVLALEGGR